MNCPRCGSPMHAHTLDGHLERSLSLDVCDPCQAIWFDLRENVQLTPGSTLALFRIIGEHVGPPKLHGSDLATCPRCHAMLRRARDLQRATKFEYFKCPNNHGRLISFFEFLKEKDFIRPLTPKQIAELRKNIQTVNCSNCGAPIDLVTHAECAHCRSPLSMLDMKQAETLVQQLRDADQKDQTVDAALPLRLARARRETEQAFRDIPGDLNLDDGASLGLVGAGLSALARWLSEE